MEDGWFWLIELGGERVWRWEIRIPGESGGVGWYEQSGQVCKRNFVDGAGDGVGFTVQSRQ